MIKASRTTAAIDKPTSAPTLLPWLLRLPLDELCDAAGQARLLHHQAVEIQGVKIFQCCASISYANMKHFKAFILNKMDMKAVPLDEHEMRALISVSMSSVKGQNKDFNCACVCEPPEPLPKVPYTEKLLRRIHTANESFSSSSLALVRWTRYDHRRSSEAQCIQSPGVREREAGHEYAQRQEDMHNFWSCADLPLTRSTTRLYPLDSQSGNGMIHTIILDFSMVHFVDLQASNLLRKLCHMFQNIGITILIAACHPTVLRTLEKTDFFEQCVTKARFFPTLHDAVLFAVEHNILKETVPLPTNDILPEKVLADVHLEDQKDKRSLQSGKRSSLQSGRGSLRSGRGSLQTNEIRDTASVKADPSEIYVDEPTSDIFRRFSLQSDAEAVPHHHLEMSGLEEEEDENDWEKKWKYTSDI